MRRLTGSGFRLSSAINPLLVTGALVYIVVVASGSLAFDRGSVAQQVRDVFWFALLCGAAASATIEIIKRIFLVRGHFQMRATQAWLTERLRDGKHTDPGFGESDVYSQLLEAMGFTLPDRLERRDAVLRVFNLPTEHLTAQISSAVETALSEPRHRLLIRSFVGDALDSESSAGADMQSQRVRAGVDLLQISLGERWRRYVQGAALWMSAAFGIALIEGSAGHSGAEARYVLAALLVGGLFAWVLRDIAAVIERSRR